MNMWGKVHVGNVGDRFNWGPSKLLNSQEWGMVRTCFCSPGLRGKDSDADTGRARPGSTG